MSESNDYFNDILIDVLCDFHCKNKINQLCKDHGISRNKQIERLISLLSKEFEDLNKTIISQNAKIKEYERCSE